MAERNSPQIFLFEIVVSSAKTILAIPFLTRAVLSRYKCYELMTYSESAAFDKILLLRKHTMLSRRSFLLKQKKSIY